MKTTATAAAVLALMSGLGLSAAALAQSADAPATKEAIIGSQVVEEEVEAAAEPDRVIAAIEKTPENIARVRTTTKLERVDIVFLPDAAAAEGGPPDEIAAKVEERGDEIAELRQELEGNAMLYHAIDSRQVLTKDVLAVEFEDDGVTIYAAAKPPG